MSQFEDLLLAMCPDILFLCTGGTIDKHYPRTVGGYSFEFGPPAVEKILSRVRPGQAFSSRLVRNTLYRVVTNTLYRVVWNTFPSCKYLVHCTGWCLYVEKIVKISQTTTELRSWLTSPPPPATR